jgi:hypothetical protein
MRRLWLSLAIAGLAGCGGPGSPHSTGLPPSPLMGYTPVPQSINAVLDSLGLPQTIATDSPLVVADFDAERREAADSAADEAVLEELADAHPEGDAEDSEEAGETGGANAVADAVTWDIDVTTFNSHARVQYYLDFFQDRGRERMAIWLTRLPRYESMIRERLQREGLPGDLVYLALIESGFSNTATSRAKAVGMW